MLRRRLAAAITATVVVWLPVTAAADVDTGGYPNASMPCEWFPQATSGPPHTQWCQDFDWGPTPSTLFAGQESVDTSSTISPRGFGYRNCTDYVAVKLGFDSHTIHGNASQWKDQVPPVNVTNYPTIGSVAWWGKEVDGGLGHVAVVLSLNPDGSALIGEYNNYLDGTYDARTIAPNGADAFLHVKDDALPGGVAFVPGYHPRLPAPSPTAPAKRPAPPPAPTPAPPTPVRSPSPTPPNPSPPAPDPKVLAAGALAGLGPSFVSFEPARVMRPNASRLVEARINRTDQLAAALDQQLAPSRTPPLASGNLMTVTLEGPDFRIAPTTPAGQSVVGSGAAVWQWTVTPLRRGTRVLTLCFSVDVNTADGPQRSSSTCTLKRPVQVTEVPVLASLGLTRASAPWVVGVALVVVVAAGGTAVVRRRRHTSAT
ncbi:MAG TPA: CHAP domain-containing protein [Actinomycetota bacterium]|nr:CHAP domain-containing protein [Actinomycetota bacterium]